MSEKINCSLCHREVKETVHTATTYKVDYYGRSNGKDGKLVEIWCKECFHDKIKK